MQLARALAAADPARRWERAAQAIFLFCIAAAAVVSGPDLPVRFAEPAEDIFELLSLVFALTGVAVRMAEHGFADRSRPGVSLQTTGMHSVVRYPELLSNLLIAAGLVMGTQAIWLIASGVVLLPLYAWLAVRTRDEETARHLGAIIASWRGETPALFLDLSRWDSGKTMFSLTKAFERGLPNLVLCLAALTGFEIVSDLKTGGASVQAWPEDWWFYIVPLAATLMLALFMRAQSRSMRAS